MHLSLSIFWFNDNLSFEYPFETLGFHVRMDEMNFRIICIVYSFFSFTLLIQWWTLFLQKTQSLQILIRGLTRRVLGLWPSPPPVYYVWIFFSHAMFHAFISLHYVVYSSIVYLLFWYILHAWLMVQLIKVIVKLIQVVQIKANRKVWRF